jgi:methyl-accepting chemotaxis protein
MNVREFGSTLRGRLMLVSAVFAVGIGASSLVFLGVFTDIRANDAVYDAVRGRLLVLAVLWGVLLVGALWALRDFFGRLSRAIRSVQGESERLTEAVAAGKLDVRAEAGAVVPEFRGVIAGMNQTMDAFSPLAVAIECNSRIARADLPERLANDWKGDFGKLRDAINGIIDMVAKRSADIRMLIEAASSGQLGARADLSKYPGYNGRMMAGINSLIDSLVKPLQTTAEQLTRLSKGDMPPKIAEPWPGDLERIRVALNTSVDAVNLLMADANRVAGATARGALDVRADASHHQGDFRKIVEAMNASVDGVARPVTAAADALSRMARGDTPPPLEQRFEGAFDQIRLHLNQVIDSLRVLVDEVGVVLVAAKEGDLSKRANADRAQGVYRKILRGVNDTVGGLATPMAEAVTILAALQQRDLRLRMKGEYKGDHARLRDSVNGTAEALNATLAQVSAAVEQLASAAGQIAASSKSVADGASQQASSIEETSSSLESMASMAKHAAENAQQANALAQAARESASRGGTSMGQMVGAMGRIRASAEGTSQIIKDINEIAFQTNLLALNAAVEAARAGEAGRGFAVVAEEVRSLALRSKQAATKTEELIRQSVKEAEEGETTSVEVSKMLSEIAGAVTKVTDIMGEIAANSKEQAQGIEQVNQAVGLMDRVVQQNAASSEESSASASELSGQTTDLQEIVSTFQLERRADGPAAGPSARPAARPATRPAARPSPVAAAPRAPAAPSQSREVFPLDEQEQASLPDF